MALNSEVNSSSVHWTKTELELLLNSLLNFFNWAQSQFKEGWVPPDKEGKELFCESWQGKSPVPPLFYKGALHSLWIDFELSSKKFNGELGSSSSSVFVEWTELELTAEFNAVNWTWIELFELYTALIVRHGPFQGQIYDPSLRTMDFSSPVLYTRGEGLT